MQTIEPSRESLPKSIGQMYDFFREDLDGYVVVGAISCITFCVNSSMLGEGAGQKEHTLDGEKGSVLEIGRETGHWWTALVT